MPFQLIPSRIVVSLSVDIPAIDRVMDFLIGKQQAEIDELTERLQKSGAALEAVVKTPQTP